MLGKEVRFQEAAIEGCREEAQCWESADKEGREEERRQEGCPQEGGASKKSRA